MCITNDDASCKLFHALELELENENENMKIEIEN